MKKVKNFVKKRTLLCNENHQDFSFNQYSKNLILSKDLIIVRYIIRGPFSYIIVQSKERYGK